jgi:hypothetical protein
MRLFAAIREVGNPRGHKNHSGEEVLVGQIVVLKRVTSGDEIRQRCGDIDQLIELDGREACYVGENEKGRIGKPSSRLLSRGQVEGWIR